MASNGSLTRMSSDERSGFSHALVAKSSRLIRISVGAGGGRRGRMRSEGRGKKVEADSLSIRREKSRKEIRRYP